MTTCTTKLKKYFRQKSWFLHPEQRQAIFKHYCALETGTNPEHLKRLFPILFNFDAESEFAHGYFGREVGYYVQNGELTDDHHKYERFSHECFIKGINKCSGGMYPIFEIAFSRKPGLASHIKSVIIDEEIKSIMSQKFTSEQVEFVTGKTKEYLSKKNIKIDHIAEVYMSTAEQKDYKTSDSNLNIMNYLNSQHDQIMWRNLKKDSAKIQDIKDYIESLDTSDKVKYSYLKALDDAISNEPIYFIGKNSYRVFSKDSHINLPKFIKGRLFSKYSGGQYHQGSIFDFDLKGAYVAILEKVIGLPTIKEEVLSKGKDLFKTILQDLKLNESLRPIFKEKVYSICFGMGRDGVLNGTTDENGNPTSTGLLALVPEELAESFLQHKYVKEIFAQRDLWMKQQKDDPLIALHLACSKIEADIISKAVDFIKENQTNMKLFLYQYDGISIQFVGNASKREEKRLQLVAELCNKIKEFCLSISVMTEIELKNLVIEKS